MCGRMQQPVVAAARINNTGKRHGDGTRQLHGAEFITCHIIIHWRQESHMLMILVDTYKGDVVSTALIGSCIDRFV